MIFFAFEFEYFFQIFKFSKTHFTKISLNVTKYFFFNLVFFMHLHSLPLIINDLSSFILFSLFISPPLIKYTQSLNTFTKYLSKFTQPMYLHFNNTPNSERNTAQSPVILEKDIQTSTALILKTNNLISLVLGFNF